MAATELGQFRHGVPGFEMPEASGGIQVAVEPDGRFLPDFFVRIQTAIWAPNSDRLDRFRPGIPWPVEIEAAVVGAVGRLPHDVPNAVQRLGRQDGHQSVQVGHDDLDAHRVRMLRIAGVDVGHGGREGLLAGHHHLVVRRIV